MTVYDGVLVSEYPGTTHKSKAAAQNRARIIQFPWNFQAADVA